MKKSLVIAESSDIAPNLVGASIVGLAVWAVILEMIAVLT
jgi:hypothetical protein